MSTSQGTVNGKANTDTLVTMGEVKIDRAKLDKTVVAAFKKENATLTDLLQLMDDSWWSQIWLDARVVDADGKPFASWGKWFANRVADYPIAKSAITAPFVKRMLENASVREVVAASGMSRGYVHELNLERQGKPTTKQKRQARNQGGTGAKGAKGATTEATTAAATEAAKGADVAAIVTALLPLVTKSIDLIAEMDADTLAAFDKAMRDGHMASAAMVNVNAENARKAKVPADEGAKVPAKVPA